MRVPMPEMLHEAFRGSDAGNPDRRRLSLRVMVSGGWFIPGIFSVVSFESQYRL